MKKQIASKRAHREGIRVVVVNEPGYSQSPYVQSIIGLYICQEFSFTGILTE
jgi:hypothetical protein